MNEEHKKFDLTHGNSDLKAYFFTVQDGPLQLEVAEDFKVVIAYNDQGAFEHVRMYYPKGKVISVRKRGEMPIKNIIDHINLWPTRPYARPIEVINKKEPQKEKSAEQFIQGLMLVADKFVTEKRDQASLKRIIGKIKV